METSGFMKYFVGTIDFESKIYKSLTLAEVCFRMLQKKSENIPLKQLKKCYQTKMSK